MTLGMMIVNMAVSMGWSMTADAELVKKLVGDNEVVIDPLEAQRAIMPLLTDRKPMEEVIADFLLEAEGSAVLKLMGEDIEF